MVIITCRIGNSQKRVEVNISDPLCILLKKLNLKNKSSKFLFNGQAFSLSSTNTFMEIGLDCDCVIIIGTDFNAGGGP